MTSSDLEAIVRRCSAAAERAEGWMLHHLDEEAIIGSDLPDPVRYYKWPLALHWRGCREEAGALLDWIAERCLTPEGDFASARAGFHEEFHSYANLWLIWSAADMGRTGLARRGLDFLLAHQKVDTGGLATNPVDRSIPYQDPLSTSFLGVVACALGREDVCRRALSYLEALFEKQPELPTRFWLRTLRDGALVTEVPPDADPTTFVIELGQRHQCYYFFGAMCYLVARCVKVFGEEQARPLAERIAGLLEAAGEDALSSIWAAKVGPGCVALYSATGEERHLGLARPVVQAVLDAQSGKGYWLKEGKPWITVSAEQCAWLTEIARLLKEEEAS